jgi:phosphoenolpyruvate-protein kinase (PTS system EI component)
MRRFQEVPSSAGVAIGPTWIYHPVQVEVEKYRIQDPDAEWLRVRAAINVTRNQLQALEERAKISVGEQEAEIIEAHQEFLMDVELIHDI